MICITGEGLCFQDETVRACSTTCIQVSGQQTNPDTKKISQNQGIIYAIHPIFLIEDVVDGQRSYKFSKRPTICDKW